MKKLIIIRKEKVILLKYLFHRVWLDINTEVK